MNDAAKVREPIVLLIDGECNMCHGIARFVIRRDPRGRFRFASQQSEYGRRRLAEGGLHADRMDTFVMIDRGTFYTKSTAALRVCMKLGLPWALASVGLIVPRFLRDRVYGFVAERRYRWFGKQEACLLPTPEVRSRFLDLAPGD
ncbi:thiol-disulfide oxidoreductase DCC family protein [Paenibacillaceae bacterium WGS1546]|uniref:thiol-disulfide oxidoreductase DCC family protein n=1 Tax=Cohnella sp. WGS1546 TaxID=3366810 RepID=UPI00372D4379